VSLQIQQGIVSFVLSHPSAEAAEGPWRVAFSALPVPKEAVESTTGLISVNGF